MGRSILISATFFVFGIMLIGNELIRLYNGHETGEAMAAGAVSIVYSIARYYFFREDK